MVKNTPIQHPIKPTIDAIPATISNAKRRNGCLAIITTLDLIASVASNFPKTINGIVKKVKNDIVMEIIVPMILIPENSIAIESPALIKVIRNVETIISLK